MLERARRARIRIYLGKCSARARQTRLRATANRPQTRETRTREKGKKHTHISIAAAASATGGSRAAEPAAVGDGRGLLDDAAAIAHFRLAGLAARGHRRKRHEPRGGRGGVRGEPRGGSQDDKTSQLPEGAAGHREAALAAAQRLLRHRRSSAGPFRGSSTGARGDAHVSPVAAPPCLRHLQVCQCATRLIHRVDGMNGAAVRPSSLIWAEGLCPASRLSGADGL